MKTSEYILILRSMLLQFGDRELHDAFDEEIPVPVVYDPQPDEPDVPCFIVAYLAYEPDDIDVAPSLAELRVID